MVDAFVQVDVQDVFDLSYDQLLPQQQQQQRLHEVVDDFLTLERDSYGCIVVPVVQTYPFDGEFVGIGDDGAFFDAYMHHMLG